MVLRCYSNAVQEVDRDKVCALIRLDFIHILRKVKIFWIIFVFEYLCDYFPRWAFIHIEIKKSHAGPRKTRIPEAFTVCVKPAT